MTEQEKDEMRACHENRLIECNYPPKIVDELRADREKWLAKIRTKNHV